MNYQPIAAKADVAGRWATVLLGLSIPISVALDNVLMGLVGLLWLLGGNLGAKFATVKHNPAAVAALLLFGVLTLGTLYTSGNPGVLFKYIDLLFIPVFLTLFQAARTRTRGLQLFCVAAIASIVVSYLAYLGLLTDSTLLRRSPEYLTGFKYSITHGLITAFAAYLFALLARDEQNKKRRMIYIALALFAAHNVVFMVFSRTGYVVLTVLFFYFFVATLGRRGLILITVVATATFLTAYATSDTFHQRINAAAHEGMDWQPGKPSATSVGLRLEWYAASLGIIRERPLLGYGTGSFPTVYATAIAGKNMVATENPHNEYLMIAVQTGLIGLACLLYLFWRAWDVAGRLQQPFYRDLGRGLVMTFVVGCLFNSLLIDHTEGLLFAWLSGLVFAAPRQPPQQGAP